METQLPILCKEILLIFKVNNIKINGSLSAETLLGYFSNNLKGISKGLNWLIINGFIVMNKKQIGYYHLTEAGYNRTTI